jgi:hypothetical protein
MYTKNHTDGALECVLFADDLTLLVQALKAYEEDYHPEIKAAGQCGALDSLRNSFELGAHLIALVNDSAASPEQVRKINREVRRDFGFYTINEEGKEAA